MAKSKTLIHGVWVPVVIVKIKGKYTKISHNLVDMKEELKKMGDSIDT